MKVKTLLTGVLLLLCVSAYSGTEEPSANTTSANMPESADTITVDEVAAEDSIAIDEEDTTVPVDVKNAREAFIHFPASVLDLLEENTRRDMLDYYDQADTVRKVSNTLDGLSWLEPPVTDRYLKVRPTPLSSMTIRMLSAGKDTIFAVVYTISGNGTAGDSEISFWNTKMKRLPFAKYIRLAGITDFIKRERYDKEQKEEILSMIPYPTVEYSFTPQSDTLSVRLTVNEYLGVETASYLAPYMRPERKYVWEGKKFKMLE